MANSKLNNSSKLTVTEADICCQPCASGLGHNFYLLLPDGASNSFRVKI